jgi:hypothetical protein
MTNPTEKQYRNEIDAELLNQKVADMDAEAEAFAADAANGFGEDDEDETAE